MSDLTPSLTSIYTAHKIMSTYKKSSNKRISLYTHLAIILFFVIIGITLYSRYKKKLKKKEVTKENKLKMKKKIRWLHNKMKSQEEVKKRREDERLIQQTTKFFAPPHSTIPTLSYKNHYVDSVNLMDRIQKNRFNTEEIALNPYLV